MEAEQKTERLRSMVRTYEGPHHTVLGVSLQAGEPRYIDVGPRFSEALPEDLIFEIGSITKVFTAILLCLMVEEGKVDPHAPVREMSGRLADVPCEITPQGLVSHTSGLPRLHVPVWKALIKPLPADPYAGFSRADLLAWFHDRRAMAPRSRPRHAYSNLGFALLGEAMALNEGMPFSNLLAERVIAPLGLVDTTDRLDADQLRRFVQPRQTSGIAVLPWTFQAMAAAGCLRSSGRDMARFADRVIRALDAPETTLDRAICRSTMPVFGLGRKGRTAPSAQCSGWRSMSFGKADAAYIHHDGATAGSTCALYICPEKAEACAILSNNGIEADLWASIRLSWSSQLRQAHAYFTAT